MAVAAEDDPTVCLTAVAADQAAASDTAELEASTPAATAAGVATAADGHPAGGPQAAAEGAAMAAVASEDDPSDHLTVVAVDSAAANDTVDLEAPTPAATAGGAASATDGQPTGGPQAAAEEDGEGDYLDIDGIEATIAEQDEPERPAAASMAEELQSRNSSRFTVDQPSAQANRGPAKTIGFDVVINRGSRNIGLNVNKRPLGLLIAEVLDDGPAKEWNESGAGPRLQRGDLIVMVNGLASTPEDLLQAVKDSEQLVLSVRRLLEYVVAINKENQKKIGLEVCSRQGTHLYIKEIKEGAVSEWNRNSRPELCVREGDLIIQINTAVGNSSAMLRTIRDTTAVKILLKRPEFAEGRKEYQPGERTISVRWGHPVLAEAPVLPLLGALREPPPPPPEEELEGLPFVSCSVSETSVATPVSRTSGAGTARTSVRRSFESALAAVRAPFSSRGQRESAALHGTEQQPVR